MSPTSRTANAHQHVSRPQPSSIIRTRSQQQHPLSQVDLSASPLKEAIRNHNHNNDDNNNDDNNNDDDDDNNSTFIASHQILQDPREDVGSRSMEPPNDDIEEPSAHKKRAPSPSFSVSGHAGKRVRVLGQSTKSNIVSRRHSEESLGTPRKESACFPVNAAPPLKRAVSSGSSVKEIVHLDLTKVPQSPSKLPRSPTKSFHITVDGGRIINVPVTPRKSPNGEVGGMPHTSQHHVVKISTMTPSDSKDDRDKRPPISSPPKFAPAQQLSVKSTQNQLNSSFFGGVTRSHKDTATSSNPSVSIQLQSTPIRPQLLEHGLLFGGSPLTPLPPTPHPASIPLPPTPHPASIPLPPTPHPASIPLPPTPHPASIPLPRRSLLPQSASNGEIKSGGVLFALPPSNSLDAARLVQASPSKSRIPVPTNTATSQVSRSSSALSLTEAVPVGLSGPTKSLRHHIKSKPKVRRKPKAEIRSKAPITRLAAKRGIRRTSSFESGFLAGAVSSAGRTLLAPPAGPSSSGNATGVDSKQSLLTSFLSPAMSPAVSRPSLLPSLASTSASPSRPTPLSALSTALQKLLVNPPAPPKHRPRSNTSLGFARSSHGAVPPLKSQTAQSKVTNAEVCPNMQPTRPQTSLGHTHTPGLPTGLGRIGLPVRQSGPNIGSGKHVMPSGTLFASKRTSLSTVPASPARSAVVPSERSNSPRSQAPQKDVLDVDAWAPSVPTENAKRKSEDPENIEYTVPLADEIRATREPPLGLVSPSRRASHASHTLSQSLSLPHALPARSGLARSASTSSTVPYIPRTPVKTRGRSKPLPPAPDTDENPKQNGPMGGKRSNARMPGSLNVLKDCVIFVDVRTEDGEDAGALFIDMLRGLGARILVKPGKSCTHLVYKDGSPLTITKYKLLPEPRPLPVSIGWVVECVEKREHVDETRFLVNLDDIGISGGAQRRRSMQPKIMRTVTLGQLDSGQSADISVRADSSFTSEEPSMSGPILIALSPPGRSFSDTLPPLERARQRSFNLSRGN